MSELDNPEVFAEGFEKGEEQGIKIGREKGRAEAKKELLEELEKENQCMLTNEDKKVIEGFDIHKRMIGCFVMEQRKEAKGRE